MGLISKHIKIELIKETIKSLTDEQRLSEITKNDKNIFEVRELAAKQITDNTLLKDIIFDSSNTNYSKDYIGDIREIAAKQITDDETLLEVVTSYYDESIDTQYGLNVVEAAVERMSNDNMLLDISESNYDENVIKIAIERLNDDFDNYDESKLTIACNDDNKVKRMCAIDQIDDDEILLDIAMHAKYLDVRERALNKIKIDDERIPMLKDLIIKEKEYNETVYDTISSDEEEKQSKTIYNQAKEIKDGYAKIGNNKKEKFYNNQSKLFKIQNK